MRLPSSLRDYYGADDLVRERLALGIPDREQPADVAGERVKDVADIAGEGHAGADRLTGLLAEQAQAERLLPQRLTGPAGLDAPVVDPPPDGREGEQEPDDRVAGKDCDQFQHEDGH